MFGHFLAIFSGSASQASCFSTHMFISNSISKMFKGSTNHCIFIMLAILHQPMGLEHLFIFSIPIGWCSLLSIVKVQGLCSLSLNWAVLIFGGHPYIDFTQSISFLTHPFRKRMCPGLWVSSSFHFQQLLVEYLATQTGGATVNNIFEVRFAYTKID